MVSVIIATGPIVTSTLKRHAKIQSNIEADIDWFLSSLTNFHNDSLVIVTIASILMTLQGVFEVTPF